MLTLYQHLVVFKLDGYYAEVPGLLAPDNFPILFLFFFSFSDRPTQNQKTHSTINEKKGDGLITGSNSSMQTDKMDDGKGSRAHVFIEATAILFTNE